MKSLTKIKGDKIRAEFRPQAWVLLLVLTTSVLTIESWWPHINIGTRGESYGDLVSGSPTGEKPQSKLWWHDDSWWASLWDVEQNCLAIYRYDSGVDRWISTGTRLDARPTSRSDILCDGQQLFVASQSYSQKGHAVVDPGGQLRRFHYDSMRKCYVADAGFPVTINQSASETLVIDKDSQDRIWATWIERGRVMVAHSGTDQRLWNKPFQIPLAGSDVDEDDISSLIALPDRQIAVMWSNQRDGNLYFALHRDADADANWGNSGAIPSAKPVADVADDHMDLKYSAVLDSSLFIVRKTSASSSGDVLISLLRRSSKGLWSSYPVAQVQDRHTRPILLIDEDHERLYVFATSHKYPINSIFMKESDANNIFFTTGLGTPFIRSIFDRHLNNPTTTKQVVNARSGLMVIASDTTNRRYLYHYMPLKGGPS